jgi:hypothetical protein
MVLSGGLLLLLLLNYHYYSPIMRVGMIPILAFLQTRVPPGDQNESFHRLTFVLYIVDVIIIIIVTIPITILLVLLLLLL